MGRRSRTEALRRAALKTWNEQADQWDGEAVVYNPFDRVYEPATQYQNNLARPMMSAFDRLPPHRRRAVANSVDGYF